MIRGDRLVYSAGIVSLSLLAAIIIVIFQADEIAMLPLYALGVMLGFSLSQAGMFRLMSRIGNLKPGEILHTKVTKVHYEKGSKWKRAVNALGAIVTSIVFLVLLVTKFIEGAWIIAVIIPLVISMFFYINKQGCGVADVVIVPIADVHRGTLLAMQYARRLSTDVRVLTVFTDDTSRKRFDKRWKKFSEITEGLNLISIEYDYRDILNPIISYIKNVNDHEFKDQITTVVVPEFIPESKLASWLHNQTAARLRNLLRDDKDIVLIEVPFHVDDRNSHLFEAEPPCNGEETNGEEIIETLIQVITDESEPQHFLPEDDLEQNQQNKFDSKNQQSSE